MANNLNLKGIGKNGGFLLSNPGPLDVRTVVETFDNLSVLVSEERAFEGMIVYVKNGSKHYTYKNSKWEELSSCITTDLATTVEVGGLPAGTNLQGRSTTEVLESMLYPFAITGLSLLDESGNTISLPLEYGHDITVAKVIPTFTVGPTPINSITITTERGTELYRDTSAASGTTISLTTKKDYTDKATGTIYCTLSDGITTITRSVEVSREYYTYYNVTDTAAEPIYNSEKSFAENVEAGYWRPVGSSSLTDIEINADAGKYVWIATTTPIDVTKDGICEYNELGKSYNNSVLTPRSSNKTLTNQHGHDCNSNYYFYRLFTPRKKSGLAKFKLGKNT